MIIKVDNERKKVLQEEKEKLLKSLQSKKEDERDYYEKVKDGIEKDRWYRKYDRDNNEFTAFDLREENDEGYFDDDDFYVNYKEKSDPWYESVKDQAKEMELLGRKTKRNEKKKSNREWAGEGEGESSSSNEALNEKEEKEISRYGDEDLYYIEEKVTAEESKVIKDKIKENRLILADMLINNKETVNQAIKRLKPITKVVSKRKDIKDNKAEGQKYKTNDDKENKPKLTEAFNSLLSIISSLTELAYFDVYSDSIDKIIRDYGENSIIKWKYKTISLKDSKEEQFGTFTMDQMLEWNKMNYFNNNSSIQFLFCSIDPRDSVDDTNSNQNEIWFDKNDPLFKLYFK